MALIFGKTSKNDLNRYLSKNQRIHELKALTLNPIDLTPRSNQISTALTR